MKNQKNSLQFLVQAALIAALYCALSLTLPFMTFGTVQCRLSEALTILPVLTPAAVPGLIVGCLISNSIGLAMGANVAGAMDILLGTLATALAALLTRAWRRYRIKGLPVLSTLPPVLINAVIIGAELTVVLFPERTPALFLINMLSVGIGQVIACVIGGLLLFAVLKRVRPLQNYWEQEKG